VLTAAPAADVIAHALALGFAKRVAHPLGDVIQVPEDQASPLGYFRNNVLHAYALPALVASLLAGTRETNADAIVAFAEDMHPFLKAELMLRHTAEEAATEARLFADLFVELGLARKAQDGQLRAADLYSPDRIRLEMLARSLRQLLRRHYLTVALLTGLGSGAVTRARLEELVQMLTQRLSLLFEFAPPDFYERSAFAAYVDTLLETGIVHEDAEHRLQFDRRIRGSAKSVERLLPPDAVVAIRRITTDETRNNRVASA
jgi:glycerol-3-phosphate O-acyltransferase